MKMNRQTLRQQLLSQYGEERAKAQHEAALRRAEIAKKAPLVTDLERELMRVIRETRPLLATDPEAGKRAVLELREKALAQLTQAGYTREDLQPKYKCPLCEDTGFVGEPIKRTCSCFERRLNLLCIEQEDLSIPENHNFDNFDLAVFPETAADGTPQRKQADRLLTWAQKYCDAFTGKGEASILLLGKSGAGKTFLADCITRAISDRGFSAAKISAFRLGEVLRGKHMGKDEAAEKFEMLTSVDLLFIDDLGSEPIFANVTIEYLYVIISERIERGKPLLITTNFSSEELTARYTERITSRLITPLNALIRLGGDDLRRYVK